MEKIASGDNELAWGISTGEATSKILAGKWPSACQAGGERGRG